jgi:hypothetical protein
MPKNPAGPLSNSMYYEGISTWQLQLSHRAIRAAASTDEQRTGYALEVAIVPTALRGGPTMWL